MPASRAPAFLRRYTDLPALLHVLSARRITLLDPKTWDDRNDAFFMSLYKERRKLRTVLALCFSQAPETYHHWRVFSNGPAGVCIEFDRAALLAALHGVPGVSVGAVAYATLKDARARRFSIGELPFVKRYGFEPEKEFRALYVSETEELPALDVPIALSCIRRVSLSPWMHSGLSDSTRAAIRAIDGCAKLKVSRSTLISNEHWKALGTQAT